jgi:hypothetical protein
MPTPTQADGTVLLIAPVNFAGQASAWARAAATNLDVTALSMQFSGRSAFAFPVDYRVPASVYSYSRRWQNQQWQVVTENFTHVLIEAERPLFGRKFDSILRDRALVREVAALRKAGLTVAFVSHGSDLRLPSYHRAHHEDSPFTPELMPQAARLESLARHHKKALDEAGGTVFVSTIDLLDYVPDGVWLPVVVNLEQWATASSILERERPVVVHAPTNAAIKGTDLIEPALRRLDAEGVIEYRPVSGVPHAELVEIVKTADIVLDQFRIGMYGTAAIEAMAAGRLVIGHVDEQVRDYLRREHQADLPIVEARGHEIESRLREILANRTAYRRTAALGEAYARRFHDGSFSAEALRSFLV